jgi:hypothetical protein
MTAPTSATRHRLAGRIRVALPPDEAFRLFTPRGERDWAAGWEPRFPAPTTDDTEPGTVFETQSHAGTTTWLVIDREQGRRVSYARVVPGVNAGTVTVTLEPAGGHSEVTVAYDLTALTEAGARQLRQFAADYPAYLESWRDDIGAVLRPRA